MITDVKTPNIEMIKVKSDYDYVVVLETRGAKIIPDKECLIKTPKEKEVLKLAKKAHNKFMRDSGYDPKSRLNINDPQVIKFSAL